MKRTLFLLMMIFALVQVQAQTAQIKGRVVDSANNEPLIGVTIYVEGGSVGTTTNFDGEFSLAVASDATLTISYVGYLTQQLTIGSRTDFNIALAEDIAKLDEVVVVGYGVQKKSVVTAAISKVDGDELNTTKASRVEDALKGKVSGVQITQSSGQPGSDSQIHIRGIGTVNNSDPLYIVDGMPVDGGISYLNPTDIASIEILKDAASAAIYGARAANGVILVTTKRGEKGRASVNYDFSYGLQNPWREKDVLNATEYMTLMNEIDINDGNTPRYTSSQIASAGEGTDWQSEVFNYNAPVQQHQVSVSGGSDRGNFFLSFGYYDQEGIIGGDYDKSNYTRWSVRSNNTYNLFDAPERSFLKRATAGVNISYSRAESIGIETNSEYGSVLGSAVAFSPLVDVYATEEEAAAILASNPTAVTDSNGNVYASSPSGFQEIVNPVALLDSPTNTVYNEDKIVASAWVEIDLIKGLKFKSSYGVDLAFWGSDGYGFEYYLSDMNYNDLSWVMSTMNRGFRWQIENTVSYTNTFNQKHNFNAVLGQSAQKYTYRYLGGTDYDLLVEDSTMANLDSATADSDDERAWGGTGGYDFTSLASYFGRVDYNFDERYMAQFTLRADGSSHFGPGNKWAIFPAVSAGWNLHNEPYLKDIKPKWIDALKLRFSWGLNGNENIGNFRYTSLMDGGQNYYFGGGYSVADGSNSGTMQYGSSPSYLANSDISWEESAQIDVGFDLRMFSNRLSIGFDWYKKTTKGMLMDSPIPSYVGQSAPMSNAGTMENSGVEIEVGWKHNIGKFNYSINANASYLTNVLVNLGNESGETSYQTAGASGIGDYVYASNGEEWPYFYGMKTAGIFQNWDEVNSYVNSDGDLLQPNAQPGDVIFVDYNGDGVISDDDRTKIGSGTPDWVFGLTLGAEWKGFDFNAFFQGSYGNDIFDFSQRGDIPSMNLSSWMMDRWHGEGTSNTIPRMTATDANGNWRSSDLYIKDGSYIRLKTIQIGYTFPEKISKKILMQRLRVYIAAENLLTFTKYDGFDPEIASSDYTTIGVDKGNYPQARTYLIGANISF